MPRDGRRRSSQASAEIGEDPDVGARPIRGDGWAWIMPGLGRDKAGRFIGRWRRRRSAVVAVLEQAEGDLDRVGRIGLGVRWVVGLDLEQLDADESVLGPVGAAGQAVPFGPLAGERGVGPAQVRAELGVVGQETCEAWQWMAHSLVRSASPS